MNVSPPSPSPHRPRAAGFSLLELLVAMVILAIMSAMVYSVLHSGLRFADRGSARILETERESAFLMLLAEQMRSAYFDPEQQQVAMAAEPDMLRLVTRRPLLNLDSPMVLAFYLYEPEKKTISYAEKIDYYNPDYDETYRPPMEETTLLFTSRRHLFITPGDEAGSVTITLGGEEFTLRARCR